MPILKNTIKSLHGRFTQIPNSLIEDESLSPAAKGVYCYLASKPEDWKFCMADISAHFPKPIKGALKELEDSRWIVRQTEPLKGKGTGFEWAWYIAAEPFTDEEIDTITQKHDFNYSSKSTIIVKSGGYTNTDGLTNTEEIIGNTPIYPLADSDLDTAVENFVDGWNTQLCEYCPRIAKIAVFNQARRSKIKARLAETRKYMKAHGETKDLLEYFLRDIIYDRYIHSQFLRGEVPGRNGAAAFKMGIDHVVRPEFFAKMVEYRYDDRPEHQQ